MNADNKKGAVDFILKCCFFLLILFVLDFAIGSILNHYYFKQQSGLLYRTTYALDSTKADILIFGASTANHNYYPAAFEKKFNMTCYNTGRDGLSIFYFYAVLKSDLKRYSPKVVILDFFPVEFRKEQRDYDRITALVPYYEGHPELRSIILMKSRFERLKFISKIYPYNSLAFTIIGGNLKFNKERQINWGEKGYVPMTEVWKGPLLYDTFAVKYQLDSNKINTYESFIKDCIRSKVKLYIFLSPKYENFNKNEQSVVIGQSIAKKYRIPFFDFTYDPYFRNHKELFADEGHLNDNGAKIYTEWVIDSIMKNEKQINSIQDQVNTNNIYSTISR